MTFETLLSDLRNGILTVTLNQPDKLNAFNSTVLAELRAVFEEVYGNGNITGVIITGMGEKAFAAGADIKEMSSYNPKQGKHLAASGQELLFMIERCPKPVIAAVNGFALGGGCELAMACHIRIASENATFGQPEVKLGLTPGYGGSQRLVQLVGKGKALELLMTADMIPADEALRLGLANHIVPQAQLHSFCCKLLEKIATRSPVAVASVIECVNAFFEEGTDGFKKEVEIFENCFRSGDFKEGTSAFMEKRKAKFPGR